MSVEEKGILCGLTEEARRAEELYEQRVKADFVEWNREYEELSASRSGAGLVGVLFVSALAFVFGLCVGIGIGQSM